MDKYIKESDLFKRMLNVEFKHDYDSCIKFCQSLPTADVVEVRHGRWVKELWSSKGGAYYNAYRCSECNAAYMEIEYGYNYCPNCGADMRGDEDDDTD